MSKSVNLKGHSVSFIYIKWRAQVLLAAGKYLENLNIVNSVACIWFCYRGGKGV